MRSTRVAITALMFSLLTGLVTVAAPARGATDPAAPSLQVPISASEPSGPQGLAILSPVEAGTSVQVLVTGAPEGAIATIHTGTCSQPGSAVVGLIGQLGETGQAHATIPVPFMTVADGSHLIAVHAGFDLASPVACGGIPVAEAAPTPRAESTPGGEPTPSVAEQPSPGVEPQPDPLPAPTPAPPAPTPDPACVGIPEWLAATRARLEQLTAGETELSRLATDPRAYSAALGEQVGRINVMTEQMRQEAVPEAASSIHQKLLGALQSGVAAARDLIQAYATSDPALFQQAVRTASDANAKIGEVRVSVGELDARCVPAAGD